MRNKKSEKPGLLIVESKNPKVFLKVLDSSLVVNSYQEIIKSF